MLTLCFRSKLWINSSWKHNRGHIYSCAVHVSCSYDLRKPVWPQSKLKLVLLSTTTRVTSGADAGAGAAVFSSAMSLVGSASASAFLASSAISDDLPLLSSTTRQQQNQERCLETDVAGGLLDWHGTQHLWGAEKKQRLAAESNARDGYRTASDTSYSYRLTLTADWGGHDSRPPSFALPKKNYVQISPLLVLIIRKKKSPASLFLFRCLSTLEHC